VFEVLEHTADIGFRATGPTEAAMMEEAARALVSIAVEIDDVQARDSYALAAFGEDAPSRLVNWLNEVLYYLDGERVAFCRFQVNALEETAVAAIGWGEPRDPMRHGAKRIVKGVTYHQLSIEHNNGQWVCEVYLDI
jgi:SHS2 domain-containing protein